MYTLTDDIKKDYKAMLQTFTEALTVYNEYIKSLTDKDKFKSFFTSDLEFNLLKVLHKNIMDYVPKINDLKSSISSSMSSVDNPIYAEYFNGSLDKWIDITNFINESFDDLSNNINTAKKILKEEQMEGLLNTLDRDFTKCKDSLEYLYRNFDLFITHIQQIHNFEQLDITNYDI